MGQLMSSAPTEQKRDSNTGWMSAPRAPAGCPEGLEYLATLDQLVVIRHAEMWEIFIGNQLENKFIVTNGEGEKMYYAYERSSILARRYLGRMRPYNLFIKDKNNKVILTLHRPYACDPLLCPGCPIRIHVNAPTLIGTVELTRTWLHPVFAIKNASDEIVLFIKGPIFTCKHNVIFRILTAGDKKEQVGQIMRRYVGFVKEVFSNAENFSINFPTELDVKMKAVLLGACFLIDTMFFEHHSD